MSDYENRMSAIELADAERFIARLAREDKQLGLDVPTVATRYNPRAYPGKFAASKPRVRCHGSAAFPPTPEAAQDLANGLVRPTVLWTPREGAEERVEELATFTSNRQDRTRTIETPAATVETTRAAVQPAIAHDFTS